MNSAEEFLDGLNAGATEEALTLQHSDKIAFTDYSPNFTWQLQHKPPRLFNPKEGHVYFFRDGSVLAIAQVEKKGTLETIAVVWDGAASAMAIVPQNICVIEEAK
jgi:hypothetical protein